MTNFLNNHFVLPDALPTTRLDAAIRLILPDNGIRAVRRIWQTHEVLVNERARHPGFMVKAGDSIRFAPIPEQEIQANSIHSFPRIRILKYTRGMIAFFKPSGLHTAHISYNTNENLEKILRDKWDELRNSYHTCGESQEKNSPLSSVPPELVTRLDMETSGIVLGIFPDNSQSINVESFRAMEKGGKVTKTYLAVIFDKPDIPFTIKNKLDTDNRKKTKVLSDEEPDENRHTHVEPIRLIEKTDRYFQDSEKIVEEKLSLVRVTIHRGARHQIRAHLAHAGFPIVGDELYAPEKTLGRRLFLHHAKVKMPEFSVSCSPGWEDRMELEKQL